MTVALQLSDRAFGHFVRLRITHRLHGSIDGMQLDRFQPGLVYDVGTTLAGVLLAEQWAEPVDDYESTVTPVTSVRRFADPEHPHKSGQWRRRPARHHVALAADRTPRRSKKQHR